MNTAEQSEIKKTEWESKLTREEQLPRARKKINIRRNVFPHRHLYYCLGCYNTRVEKFSCHWNIRIHILYIVSPTINFSTNIQRETIYVYNMCIHMKSYVNAKTIIQNKHIPLINTPSYKLKTTRFNNVFKIINCSV